MMLPCVRKPKGRHKQVIPGRTIQIRETLFANNVYARPAPSSNRMTMRWSMLTGVLADGRKQRQHGYTVGMEEGQ